ncbi:MAG: hypothetical protein AB1497_06815 [Bacillota bacterium]
MICPFTLGIESIIKYDCFRSSCQWYDEPAARCMLISLAEALAPAQPPEPADRAAICPFTLLAKSLTKVPCYASRCGWFHQDLGQCSVRILSSAAKELMRLRQEQSPVTGD